MRELLPPARIIAETGDWGLGIGDWGDIRKIKKQN
jgi:hypothetical protein